MYNHRITWTLRLAKARPLPRHARVLSLPVAKTQVRLGDAMESPLNSFQPIRLICALWLCFILPVPTTGDGPCHLWTHDLNGY